VAPSTSITSNCKERHMGIYVSVRPSPS
jgi:hypothetical protein